MAEATAGIAIRGEAAEVARGEAQAVLASARDGAYRERLADLVAAVSEGSLGGAEAETLEELLQVGLQTGRLRALYGPAGETAALALYRRLPDGRELQRTAREVTDALRAFAGAELHGLSVEAVGPGVFSLRLAAGDAETSIRLDRRGARIVGVGV